MDTDQRLQSAIRTVPDHPKPGIQFKDITPLLADATLLGLAADALAAPFRRDKVTKVVGVESRGFILGSLLAQRLGAGFVPVRKKGKLPYRVRTVEYSLEYGADAIEIHTDAVTRDDNVLIHDDVIATGGTAAACHALITQAGANVIGYTFLLELAALGGRARLPGATRIHSVLVM